MRRVLSLVAASALTVALAAPVAATEPTPTLYIALGDSLAWGDGASDPASTAYVPLLTDYFAGAAHGGAGRLVNLGVRGDDTGDLLAGQLPAAVGLIADSASDTRVITISIGGNDLLDLINGPDDPCIVEGPSSPTCQGLLAAAMGGVATNVPQALYALRAALAADPGPEKIFVLLPYNAFDGTGHPLEAVIAQALRGTDPGAGCGDTGLDDILACSAGTFGAVTVDSYPLFAGRTFELTHMGEGFNVHPNDDGYEVIAKAHRVADRNS